MRLRGAAGGARSDGRTEGREAAEGRQGSLIVSLFAVFYPRCSSHVLMPAPQKCNATLCPRPPRACVFALNDVRGSLRARPRFAPTPRRAKQPVRRRRVSLTPFSPSRTTRRSGLAGSPLCSRYGMDCFRSARRRARALLYGVPSPHTIPPPTAGTAYECLPKCRCLSGPWSRLVRRRGRGASHTRHPQLKSSQRQPRRHSPRNRRAQTRCGRPRECANLAG